MRVRLALQKVCGTESAWGNCNGIGVIKGLILCTISLKSNMTDLLRFFVITDPVQERA